MDLLITIIMPPNRKRPRNSTDSDASVTKNAFDYLMAHQQDQSPRTTTTVSASTKSSSNKRRKSSIHFIPCPAGCGQHIAAHNVNRHLDQCFDRQNPENPVKTGPTMLEAPFQPMTPTVEGKIGMDETKVLNENPQSHDPVHSIAEDRVAAGTTEGQLAVSEEYLSSPPKAETMASLSQSQPSTPRMSPMSTQLEGSASIILPSGQQSPRLSEKPATAASPLQHYSSQSAEEAKTSPEHHKHEHQPHPGDISPVPKSPKGTAISTDCEPPMADSSVQLETPSPTREKNGVHGERSLDHRNKAASDVNEVSQTQVIRAAKSPPRDPVMSPSKPLQDERERSSTQDDAPASSEADCPKRTNCTDMVSTTPSSEQQKRNDTNIKSTKDAKGPSSTQGVQPGRSEPAEACGVFSRMMARSKQVFSTNQEKSSSECWFWYTEKGVSVHSVAFDARVPAWTATVKLRGGPCVHLATDLPPAATKSRYVQRHSRLSVSVLKSILQKSIRRRKPLSSVRVALELADKSLGDLLRRLPIIILEDSTLHPDIGVIVWLMMAQSKDYEPPSASMERVFRLVFEIASCQWKDSSEHGHSEDSVEFPAVIAEMKNVEKLDTTTEADQFRAGLLTCIWATMARASYGGMHGDVRMLQRFAALWLDRLRHPALPFDRVSMPPNVLKANCKWPEIPHLLHQRARGQCDSASSLCMVLVRSGIDFLRLSDTTVEGIDFHCSAVIEHLLKDEELVKLSTDILILSKEPKTPGKLGEVWKSCMWHFSSGTNHRRPLLKPTMDEDGSDSTRRYEHLWKSLAGPKALAFQQNYVRARLLAP